MRTLVLLLLMVLATPALGQTDLAMLPGQQATGEISFPGEEDHIRLGLLAGEELTLKAKGKDGLRLEVRLLDPAGTEIPLGAWLSIKKD